MDCVCVLAVSSAVSMATAALVVVMGWLAAMALEATKAAAATRDFRLEHDTDGAPLLTVFGGKITTYRRLAEAVIDRLAPHLTWARPPT